jgi:hypothetical protein
MAEKRGEERRKLRASSEDSLAAESSEFTSPEMAPGAENRAPERFCPACGNSEHDGHDRTCPDNSLPFEAALTDEDIGPKYAELRRRRAAGDSFVRDVREAITGPSSSDERAGQTRMKYLDAETLQGDGYLQEVNRAFFHPLGLALEVHMGTGRMRIWDFRDDPEGMIFAETEDLRPKAARVAEIREARRPAREAALGFWQQPVTGESNRDDVRDAVAGER